MTPPSDRGSTRPMQCPNAFMDPNTCSNMAHLDPGSHQAAPVPQTYNSACAVSLSSVGTQGASGQSLAPHSQNSQESLLPQWPSMLSIELHPMAYPQSIQSDGPGTTRATNRRKTLSDLDREEIRRYAQAHPKIKQIEIAGMLSTQCQVGRV